MARVTVSGRTFSEIRDEVDELPLALRARVAERGSTAITGLARGAYADGRTVYGGQRPDGVDGSRLTLMRTGDTFGMMRFTNDSGTRIRVRLGTPYAKYLIGNYGILPPSNAPVPNDWKAALSRELDKERNGG